MLSVIETAVARTNSLLTADVKSRKYMSVSREAIEEPLKALNIRAKMLAQMSNAMWDILFATEEVANTLAGSILTTKTMRLQTEYIGTRKTRITLNGVPVYII